MKISVVIPNYNGEHILKKNLPKIISAVGKAEVIVVDDYSKDHSLDILKKFKSEIKLLTNDKNRGFSFSVNRGVKSATGEIIILLNTDIIPEKDFLTPLLSHFEDKSVFAVGCMDKSVENGEVVLRGRGIGRWKKGFLAHSRGEVNKKDTLWVSGGSGAFRRQIWEKLGGLDELYSPFYWEDIDLSYRALKSGYKIFFEPKSVVMHMHEEGSIKSNYSESKIKSIAYRNQLIFVWKNITDSIFLLTHFLYLPYYLVYALLKGDLPFLKGFARALILVPKIVKYRNIQKKFFTMRDTQVFSPFKKEK